MAQKQVADKIVGVVGSKIILQSDVDLQAANDPSLKDMPKEEAKCNTIYTILAQQMLVEQAARDSVVVTEDEVESQINQRIRQFMQEYGGKENLERASGQTIYQLKETYRTFFKDKITAERMQHQLMDKVKVTPSEVVEFYNSIPKDSLPNIPATLEMGEIVIQPSIDPEIEQLAKEKLEGIRKEIVSDGRSFSSMANIYSMDPGSRSQGGLLTINKTDFDPAFVSAAFRLQNGEVSPVIRSQFGYHIIKMVQRLGDEAQVRHILIVPEVSTSGIRLTLKKMDSIRSELIAGKIDFAKAVGKYSTDKMSKMTGGMVMDPRTGSTSIEMSNLYDQDMIKAATSLNVGEYSQPQVFRNPRTQAQECRILYLKGRTVPHQLNLKDDYNMIQERALMKKQNEHLFEWVRGKSGDYYIRIDKDYQDCSELSRWKIEEISASH